VPERASLVADTWALTKAGKIEIVDFLKLARTMQNDDNPYVQEILSTVIMDSMLSVPRFTGFFIWIYSETVAPVKEKFGWSGAKDETLTKDLRQILRNKVLLTLGTIGGEKQTIAEARQYFKTYQQTPEQIEGGMLDPMTFYRRF